MKIRIPDYVTLYHSGKRTSPSPCPWATPIGDKVELDNPQLSSLLECPEGKIEFKIENEKLKVNATTYEYGARYVQLRWNEKMRKDVKVLGDAYERGYGDLSWCTIRPERCMPWYMAASNGSDTCLDYAGRYTECFGVGVQPNAMAFWQYDPCGITLWLDIRNGGNGVLLNGRVLECATVYFKEYRDMSAFSAVKEFCAVMSPDPSLPDHVVYGSNNWYYAYGKSSHDEIIADTKFVKEMCAECENIPYMVIDDRFSFAKSVVGRALKLRGTSKCLPLYFPLIIRIV